MKAKKITQAPSVTARPVAPPPTREQIEALAHAIWVDRGCPEGRDLDNWLEAERQLKGEIGVPAAADDIPAVDDPTEPDRAITGEVEKALDPLAKPAGQRSSTSL